MWCAVFNFGVLGPYFLEEDGITVTANSDRYCAMLQNFFRPQLGEISNIEHGVDNVWFQQDGATAHTSRRSLSLLREMFPGRVISLRGDIGWPPRSPDLTPCYFFLRLPQSKGLRTTSPNFGSSEGGDTTGSCCHYT